MALTLHLNQFDGPLDLLLFLIGKAKIDIKDIFVSQVTDQYIESVREAESLDMEDASAFIAMAATLIEIKSRSLLPKPQEENDEEDPEKLLIRQLEEIGYHVIGFEDRTQELDDYIAKSQADGDKDGLAGLCRDLQTEIAGRKRRIGYFLLVAAKPL